MSDLSCGSGATHPADAGSMMCLEPLRLAASSCWLWVVGFPVFLFVLLLTLLTGHPEMWQITKNKTSQKQKQGRAMCTAIVYQEYKKQ